MNFETMKLREGLVIFSVRFPKTVLAAALALTALFAVQFPGEREGLAVLGSRLHRDLPPGDGAHPQWETLRFLHLNQPPAGPDEDFLSDFLSGGGKQKRFK
jgi:hypothetical protein